MNTVNSLSGGRTSSYIAVHYPADYSVFSLVCLDDLKCKPKDPSVINYANNKLSKYAEMYGDFFATAEDDATLVAMMDLEQLIGREITWVRGKSFDAIISGENNTILPNRVRRYCTYHMKLLPIFNWWFQEIGEKINMRIGFRFDEFDRMEKFVNGGHNINNFSIPVSCSTRGKRLQKFEEFNWRYCSFPLVKHGILKEQVNEYWKFNGFVGGTLFEERRKIIFPKVANCVGCFHKKVDTLAIMWNLQPEKMNWFSSQETLGKGTWLDSRMLYETIRANSGNWIEEMIREDGGVACDSGSCTD